MTVRSTLGLVVVCASVLGGAYVAVEVMGIHDVPGGDASVGPVSLEAGRVDPAVSAVTAARTVDRLQIFRTGNGGDRLLLDGEELTALLRHTLPGVLPEGIVDPVIRLEDGRVRVAAVLVTGTWSGTSHLTSVFAALPDSIRVTMDGALARSSGWLVYEIDRAHADRVPLPRAVIARLAESMPIGGGTGTARAATLQVPWPQGIASIQVVDDRLALEPAEPILERAVDGGGGA